MTTSSETQMITADQVHVGDVVTIPGTSVAGCRVRAVRSAASDAVWLYFVDAAGARLRGHLAVPLDKALIRHSTGSSSEPERPEDT